MSQPLLTVSDLGVAFRRDGGWAPVVRGISFDIARRQITALVGESGSGKSVTALSIMRLLPAAARVSGRIDLAGVPLLDLDEKAMRARRGNEVAMIFQEPMTSLNPVMTIGDQMIEAVQSHRPASRSAARAAALELLDKVRIPSAASRLDQYPHHLSGGMRQRVMIAMAMVCQPKLLIADEPTTALDVTIQDQILNLICLLQEQEDMSVLFITHDMGVVAQVADNVVVMRHGRIEEEAPTGPLFDRPKSAYARMLLASVPRLGSMANVERPLPFPTVEPETGSLGEVKEVPDTIDHASLPVLKVDKLSVRFDIGSGLFGARKGCLFAVEDVSFAIRPGETLALVGESGCGKSTTGRSIMGLVAPTSGDILLAGENIVGLPEQQLRRYRRQVQMIFQDPYGSLNPKHRIGYALKEPLLTHGICSDAEATNRAVELLERVGLGSEMMNRYPHEFSGGQRQRICVARALALKPRLIIADEAVSALDVSIKAQIVNLLLNLQEEYKLSYLFISHDMAIVERVSHRVAVMREGRIVEIGSRANILQRPHHDYTKRLIEAVPVPDPSRRSTRGITLSSEEIANPVRRPDYVPPVRHYRQIENDHLVLGD